MSQIILPEFPDLWATVRLNQIVDVVYGKALRASDRVGQGQIPVYGSNGVVGTHDEALHSGPSIVIGRKGTAGAVEYVPGPFWCIDTAFYLDIIAEEIRQYVDLEFLAHSLQFIDLSRLSLAVGVPGINRSDLEKERIPLPPISEQRRVVDILRQADDLRCLRHEADKKSDQVLAALYHDMFGKMASNPDQQIPVGKVLLPNDGIRTGPFGTQLKVGELVRVGNPVYGIENVLPNRFIPVVEKFITDEKYEQLKRYDVVPNDVLLTRMGTIGRACVVPNNIPEKAIISYHLFRLRVHMEECLPEFLAATLNYSPYVSQQLENFSYGAVMAGLNAKTVRSIRMPLPPISLQASFVEFVKRYNAQLLGQESSKQFLEELFLAILSHAFTGELTAAWREQNAAQLHDEAVHRDIALGTRPIRPRLLDFESGLITQAEKEEFARLMQEAVAPAAERLAQTVSSTFQLGDVLKIEPMIDLSELVAPLSEYQATVNAKIYKGLKQVSESALESLSKSIEPIQTLVQSVSETQQRQMLELAEKISQWAALVTRRPDEDHSRYHSLQELSNEQYLLYLDATRRFERYFTIQDLCEDDDDWEPEFARRSLVLLEALGLIVSVSVPPPPDEESSNYITVYRAIQPDDDSRATDLSRLEEKYPELRV